MREEDIHIGDRLRIRQWDDMEFEFGSYGTGTIMCMFGFAKDMRYLCGRPFTIKAREEDHGNYLSEEREEFCPDAPEEDGRYLLICSNQSTIPLKSFRLQTMKLIFYSE